MALDRAYFEKIKFQRTEAEMALSMDDYYAVWGAFKFHETDEGAEFWGVRETGPLPAEQRARLREMVDAAVANNVGNVPVEVAPGDDIPEDLENMTNFGSGGWRTPAEKQAERTTRDAYNERLKLGGGRPN